MVHTVPCVGFVVQEKPRPGRLNAELLLPLIDRNTAELKSKGFPDPKKLMKAFKVMKPGDSFTFPDGTVLRGSEAVAPARRGRKIVVCGDTSDASAMVPLAMDADVLVHEATNSFLLPFDADKTRAEVPP